MQHQEMLELRLLKVKSVDIDDIENLSYILISYNTINITKQQINKRITL